MQDVIAGIIGVAVLLTLIMTLTGFITSITTLLVVVITGAIVNFCVEIFIYPREKMK